MNKPKPIKEVADEVRDALVQHIQADTREEDEQREAERDARTKAALEQLAREGKLPLRA